LEEYFERYGKVKEFRYIKPRGIAFIEYGSPGEAKTAIEKLDNKKIEGSRIVVQYKGNIF
jgi:RNA recognition motif-containing protein